MKYKIWLTISILVSLILAIACNPPDTKEDMFPLFNDLLSVFIFVPASFILASCLISLLNDSVKNIQIWIIIVVVLILTVVIVFVKLIVGINIIPLLFILTVGILLGFMHLSVSITIKRNSGECPF